MTKSFLNAPHEQLVAAERQYIRERSKVEKARVVQRHDRLVRKRSLIMERKAKAPPVAVVPRFGRWNTAKAVPVAVLAQDVDDLNLGEVDFEMEEEHERMEEDEHEVEVGLGEMVDQLDLF